MRPLEYHNIAGEEHLTFDSVRRLVFHPLSNLNESEARQHVVDCYRCRSIYESLATPAVVRKVNSSSSIESQLFGGILFVMVFTVLAFSFLHFGGSANLNLKDASTLISWSLLKIENKEITRLTPNPPQIQFTDDLISSAAPVLRSIDSPRAVSDKPAPVANKRFDSYIGIEEEHPEIRLKGIYGKITANGEPLQGVTVMVPDSRTAKVSNSGGNYYIQIPRNTASLMFIYQGKLLEKELDSASRRLDISLKIDSLVYPEIETLETRSENIADN